MVNPVILSLQDLRAIYPSALHMFEAVAQISLSLSHLVPEILGPKSWYNFSSKCIFNRF